MLITQELGGKRREKSNSNCDVKFCGSRDMMVYVNNYHVYDSDVIDMLPFFFAFIL